MANSSNLSNCSSVSVEEEHYSPEGISAKASIAKLKKFPLFPLSNKYRSAKVARRKEPTYQLLPRQSQ